MSDLGELITSERLGCDIWLIKDPAFKPTDGLAWWFPEEHPFLDTMDLEELKKVQEVKLVFPGARVRDHILRKMPPLPFNVQYKQEELIEILKKWPSKYPKGNPRAWSAEQAAARGYKNHDANGLIGEDTIGKFCSQTSLRWMKVNAKPGADKVDYIIEAWRVDVKTITTNKHWRGNNFRLRVGVYQLQKTSPINCYWFVIFNPDTLRCELYGWRPRSDYRLVEHGGLAVFREASEIERHRGGFFHDQHDLGSDEMFSEEEFFTRKGD